MLLAARICFQGRNMKLLGSLMLLLMSATCIPPTPPLPMCSVWNCHRLSKVSTCWSCIQATVIRQQLLTRTACSTAVRARSPAAASSTVWAVTQRASGATHQQQQPSAHTAFLGSSCHKTAQAARHALLALLPRWGLAVVGGWVGGWVTKGDKGAQQDLLGRE